MTVRVDMLVPLFIASQHQLDRSIEYSLGINYMESVVVVVVVVCSRSP